MSAGDARAMSASKTLVLLHYNDVYNLESGTREPVGGAARFASMVKAQTDDPFVVFAGDALNPSMASTFFKGKQMIPALNLLGTRVACVGNHDLDFGKENLRQCVAESNFPWLLANIADRADGLGLCGAVPTATFTHNGVKLGVVGLAEEEWIATLATVSASELIYEDFVACGRRLATKLREEDGCDVVVALTHAREPNDERLAREAPEFDAVLGGHDHHYVARAVEPHGVPVLKSGTEFRWATKAFFDVAPGGGARATVRWETIEITSEAFDEDPEMKKIADDVEAKLGDSMDVRVGATMVPLDGRFLKVRTQETNLGNLVCDLMRQASGAEACILNGGSLRSDVVHPIGELTFRDLVAILPMLDTTCVLKMPGAKVVAALENACSQYPALEGRFAQVSGLSYVFDAAKPPGQRVVSCEIPSGTPIDANRTYTVCTKEYLSLGKDGYDAFVGCETIRSGEESPLLPTTLRNHLLTLDVLNAMGADEIEMRGDGDADESGDAAVVRRAMNAFKRGSDSAVARALAEAARKHAESEGRGVVASPMAGKDPITGKLCLAPCVDGRIVTRNPVENIGA